jgi:hypothetical protein
MPSEVRPFVWTAYQNDRREHAIKEILETYGDAVIIKPTSLLKFGRNEDIGTSIETVWSTGGDEDYRTGNTIDKIVGMAGSTQSIVIEGHTIDGSGNFIFVTQSATLNGTNQVTLTTPLARASRAYNNSSTVLPAGVVTIIDTSNSNSIHLSIPTGKNQSFKCATTISNNDYLIITGYNFGVNRQQTRTVDFYLEVRNKGKIFRERFAATSTNGNISGVFDPCIIVPTNSDIRVRAISSSTATSVVASINGYLALVQ